MKINPLLKSLQDHYSEKLPFVVYALPNSAEITGLFQHTRSEQLFNDFTEDGFVFAPFQNKKRTYFIPTDQCTVLKTEVKKRPSNEDVVNLPEDTFAHDSYIKILGKTLNEIRNNGLKKIVISRIKEILLADFDIVTLVLSLFSEYPSAFRYVWYHPETGIWCGASPEILLKVDSEGYKTVSLAGTQKYRHGETQEWTLKERKEQDYVTEAIKAALNPYSDAMEVSETNTHKAGTLIHLRTEISGVFKKEVSLTEVLMKLHPTPAICGTPRDAAFDFILKNEGYDREFYTGFMGPVGMFESNISLFVNLRCMKIANGKATLFTGGGITNESQPEAEWQETCHKQQTMLKVLGQFL